MTSRPCRPIHYMTAHSCHPRYNGESRENIGSGCSGPRCARSVIKKWHSSVTSQGRSKTTRSSAIFQNVTCIKSSYLPSNLCNAKITYVYITFQKGWSSQLSKEAIQVLRIYQSSFGLLALQIVPLLGHPFLMHMITQCLWYRVQFHYLWQRQIPATVQIRLHHGIRLYVRRVTLQLHHGVQVGRCIEVT